MLSPTRIRTLDAITSVTAPLLVSAVRECTENQRRDRRRWMAIPPHWRNWSGQPPPQPNSLAPFQSMGWDLQTGWLAWIQWFEEEILDSERLLEDGLWQSSEFLTAISNSWSVNSHRISESGLVFYFPEHFLSFFVDLLPFAMTFCKYYQCIYTKRR